MEEPSIVSIEIDESDDPVVIIKIEIAEGHLHVMAEIDVDQRRRQITARGLHIHGEGFDANGLGLRRLRQIAVTILKELDYDEGIIEGGARTTGANPGRRPKPIRIKRKPRSAIWGQNV